MQLLDVDVQSSAVDVYLDAELFAEQLSAAAVQSSEQEELQERTLSALSDVHADSQEESALYAEERL